MRITPAAILGLCAVTLAGPVRANDQWRTSGFVSQNFIHTTQNRFYGDSERGSFDFRELGLGASYQLTPRLRAAAQGIYRRAGDADDTFVDFALLDVALWQGENSVVNAQLGRVKVPLGLFNETRDVPRTRPGILMPSVYYESLREVSAATDGVRLEAGYRFDDVNVQISLIDGNRSITTNEVEFLVLGQDTPGRLGNAELRGGLVLVTALSERLRLGYSYLDAQLGYRPGGAFDPLSAGTVDADFSIWSAEWQSERWYATAEYSRQGGVLRDFGPAIPLQGSEAEAYYGQVGWRLHPGWEWFGRREIQYLDVNDRTGVRRFLPTFGVAHIGFGKSWVVGSRYELSPRWTVQAEHHWVNGTSFLPRTENPIPPLQRREWNLLAIGITFHF